MRLQGVGSTRSSVVDEALFGKSPMGGLIHTQNTQANFWMDARGGFAKR